MLLANACQRRLQRTAVATQARPTAKPDHASERPTHIFLNFRHVRLHKPINQSSLNSQPPLLTRVYSRACVPGILETMFCLAAADWRSPRSKVFVEGFVDELSEPLTLFANFLCVSSLWACFRTFPASP